MSPSAVNSLRITSSPPPCRCGSGFWCLSHSADRLDIEVNAVNTDNETSVAGQQRAIVSIDRRHLNDSISSVDLEAWFEQQGIRLGPMVPSESREEVLRTLYTYKDLGSDGIKSLGPPTHLLQHRISITPGTKPHKAKPRRYSPQSEWWLKHIVLEGLENGLFERTIDANGRLSQWSANALIIPKKSNSKAGQVSEAEPRFCVDHHDVFENTPASVLQTARQSHDFLCLPTHRVMSKFDLKNAYWAVQVHPDDRHYLAFNVPSIGQLQPIRMMQGSRTSSHTMNELGHKAFGALPEPYCEPSLLHNDTDSRAPPDMTFYVDDIFPAHDTWEKHWHFIRHHLLPRLAWAGLKLSFKKVEIGMSEIVALGETHYAGGRKSPRPERIEKLLSWPLPQTESDVRAFLGTMTTIRPWIKNFAEIARPLYRITSDKVEWRFEESEKLSFILLKNKAANAASMFGWNPAEPVELFTDASKFAAGCFIRQRQGDHFVPIVYDSFAFTPTQRRYDTYKRELNAMTVFAHKHAHLLSCDKVSIIWTDHKPLISFLRADIEDPTLFRWREPLRVLNVEVMHIAGVRNVAADGLSRTIFPGTCEATEAVRALFSEADDHHGQADRAWFHDAHPAGFDKHAGIALEKLYPKETVDDLKCLLLNLIDSPDTQELSVEALMARTNLGDWLDASQKQNADEGEQWPGRLRKRSAPGEPMAEDDDGDVDKRSKHLDGVRRTRKLTRTAENEACASDKDGGSVLDEDQDDQLVQEDADDESEGDSAAESDVSDSVLNPRSGLNDTYCWNELCPNPVRDTAEKRLCRQCLYRRNTELEICSNEKSLTDAWKYVPAVHKPCDEPACTKRIPCLDCKAAWLAIVDAFRAEGKHPDRFGQDTHVTSDKCWNPQCTTTKEGKKLPIRVSGLCRSCHERRHREGLVAAVTGREPDDRWQLSHKGTKSSKMKECLNPYCEETPGSIAYKHITRGLCANCFNRFWKLKTEAGKRGEEPGDSWMRPTRPRRAVKLAREAAAASGPDKHGNDRVELGVGLFCDKTHPKCNTMTCPHLCCRSKNWTEAHADREIKRFGRDLPTTCSWTGTKTRCDKAHTHCDKTVCLHWCCRILERNCLTEHNWCDRATCNHDCCKIWTHWVKDRARKRIEVPKKRTWDTGNVFPLADRREMIEEQAQLQERITIALGENEVNIKQVRELSHRWRMILSVMLGQEFTLYVQTYSEKAMNEKLEYFQTAMDRQAQRLSSAAEASPGNNAATSAQPTNSADADADSDSEPLLPPRRATKRVRLAYDDTAADEPTFAAAGLSPMPSPVSQKGSARGPLDTRSTVANPATERYLDWRDISGFKDPFQALRPMLEDDDASSLAPGLPSDLSFLGGAPRPGNVLPLPIPSRTGANGASLQGTSLTSHLAMTSVQAGQHTVGATLPSPAPQQSTAISRNTSSTGTLPPSRTGTNGPYPVLSIITHLDAVYYETPRLNTPRAHSIDRLLPAATLSLECKAVMTDSEWAEWEERWYGDLKRYCMDQTRPDDQRSWSPPADWTAQRRARFYRFARWFRWEEGHLWYAQKDAIKARLCLKPEDVAKKLFEVHDRSGHFQTKEVILRLRRYYWPTMEQDVATYVQSCPNCAKWADFRRTEPILSLDALHPFEMVQADLMGDFKRSIRGNRWLLVVVCCFSGFIAVRPLPNKAGSTVSDGLNSIFNAYMKPVVLYTDPGSEFKDVPMENLRDRGIKVLADAATAHRTTGVVERANRALRGPLSKSLPSQTDSKGKSIADWDLWDDVIEKLAFHLNHRANTDSGYSPAEVMFGSTPDMIPHIDVAFPDARQKQLIRLAEASRSARIPVDDIARAHFCHVNDMLFKRAQMQGKKEELRAARQQWLNRRKKSQRPEVGDRVLCYNPGLIHDSDSRWYGPFEVHRYEGDHGKSARLLNPMTGQTMRDLRHIQHLRVIKDRPLWLCPFGVEGYDAGLPYPAHCITNAEERTHETTGNDASDARVRPPSIDTANVLAGDQPADYEPADDESPDNEPADDESPDNEPAVNAPAANTSATKAPAVKESRRSAKSTAGVRKDQSGSSHHTTTAKPKARKKKR